jgi:protein SCO1
VLEELESGFDPYLVAAAARALRSYRRPVADFLPFLMRAFANIRFSDEPLSFEAYGEYAVARSSSTAIGELVLTLSWLAPESSGSLAEIESLAELGVPQKYRRDVSRIANVIRRQRPNEQLDSACCSLADFWKDCLKLSGGCKDTQAVTSIVFEDHSGAAAPFAELFRGRPTIVVFFYTRCDNPLKCSLTITKLARVQRLLAEKGLAREIQTAAITYDPQYDHPQRMTDYGRDRGLQLDDRHRMLRSSEGLDALRSYFSLGINFIGSLVNRHRLELFILDRDGAIAVQFSRLQWDEHEVTDRAIEILHNRTAVDGGISLVPGSNRLSGGSAAGRRGLRALTWLAGMAGSVGAAFFPKCPMCWAAYLSMFGIAGLGQIPYSPWLLPVLTAAMLLNLASVAWRVRETGRLGPFYLVGAGALGILASQFGWTNTSGAIASVLLTIGGTLWSALDRLIAVRRLSMGRIAQG